MRWERVEKAYNAMVCGEGIQADDAVSRPSRLPMKSWTRPASI